MAHRRAAALPAGVPSVLHDVTMPPVNFKGQQLPNRVEGATTGGDADPIPPLNRYRVHGIETETGSTLGVTYSDADCKAGDVPSPDSNTRRCYPVMWSPPDAPAANYKPYLDWFHSYVVTQVLQSDDTGGAPVQETDYSYLDGLAWAKAKDDEFTKASELTYGDRKGYGRVQVRTGAGADKQTLKEYRYFRGIDGAQVKDSQGVTVTDKEPFAGMTREEATFDGDGGKLVSATSYEPWISAATATETRAEGLPAMKSYATGTKVETTRTAVGATWRTTQTNRTFDDIGQVLTESDLGDTAKTGDEECATTTYAHNTAANLLSLPSEVRTVAKPCGTTPSLPDDLISVARSYYDGATSLTATPSKGDLTRLDEQNAAGTGYLTTAAHTYDQYGRELTDTDALKRTTVTAYTPKTGEAPTAETETNPLGQTVKTEYDATRGTATAAVDANDKRTDSEHDGLGRVTKVWNPGWSKTDHPTQPSSQFTYIISKTASNAVATKTIQHDGTYTTSYTIYDGMLRPRETQAPAIGTTNRVITETLYDTRGFAWKTYSPYYTDGAPSSVLTAAADNQVPAATENVYDGLGRVTDAISRTYGDEKWRTKTAYDGDRTTVIPPQGGTATTVVTDGRGRATERLEYTNAARTASQKTTYTYGKYDEPTAVTDPAGNTWKFTFDNRGQQTNADDPDKGASETVYDDLGQATSTTDARGVTLSTVYDDLGRKTDLKQGDTTLAKWTYDTVAKGQLSSSSRYIDGKEYRTATDSYNDNYQPTSTTVTTPTEAGALAGTYKWTYGYNAYTGQQEWIKHPAIGNLPSERQSTVLGEGDLPQTTTAGAVTLVNSTSYDVFARPQRIQYGTLGKRVYQTQVYDDFTGKLTRQTTDRDLAPQRIDDTSYAYDPAGNITGITTASGQDAAKTVDTQCFTTDSLGRLSEAWTAKTGCDAAVSAGTVGGPDAYWQTFGYDLAGNRTKLVDHATDAAAGADATTTYTQPDPGKALPHAVQQTSVQGGAQSGTTSTFKYDGAGNTTERVIGNDTQKLTWDAEGHLATLTDNGKTASYLYDTDGNRLISKDADGSQTLTLPEGNELKVTAAGAKEASRYYTHGDQTVAVRTSSGFSYLLSDQQGTATTAIAMTTLALTRRKQLPFGQLRSEQSSEFPGTQGFVGGTTDPTGLVHLGAREYDPALGRFLSVDPIIDIDDPAQMNAYSYAHNSPVTHSDPTGLCPADLCGVGYPIGGTGQVKGDKLRFVTKAPKNSPRWQLGPYINKQGHAYTPSGKLSHQQKQGVARARAAEQAQAVARAKAAKEKAEAQRRKHDGILDKIGRGISDHWEGIKVGLTVVGFAACVVASAGACLAVGVGIATAKFVGDGALNGNWDVAAYGKDLAWSAVGSGSAATFGRAFGGASSWAEAYGANVLVRQTSVRVVRAANSLKHAVVKQSTRINWGETYGNMSINAGFNGAFCGSGNASLGAYAGAC